MRVRMAKVFGTPYEQYETTTTKIDSIPTRAPTHPTRTTTILEMLGENIEKND